MTPAILRVILTGASLCLIISCATTKKTPIHQFLHYEHEFCKTTSSIYLLEDLIKNIVPVKLKDSNNKEEIAGMLKMARDQMLAKMDGGFNKEIALLGESLASGQWRCDKFSFIFYAIGKKKNWPLDVVMAPNHVFLRWHLKNGEYINWETTNGKVYDDDFYISEFNISQEAIANRIYLRPLSDKELLAIEYNNIGKAWFNKQDYAKALSYCNKAIELWPYFSDAYNNKAITEIYMEDIDRALENLNKTIALDPNCSPAHYNRGRILLDKGKYKEALAAFHETKRLNPKNLIVLGIITYIESMQEKKG